MRHAFLSSVHCQQLQSIRTKYRKQATTMLAAKRIKFVSPSINNWNGDWFSFPWTVNCRVIFSRTQTQKNSPNTIEGIHKHLHSSRIDWNEILRRCMLLHWNEFVCAAKLILQCAKILHRRRSFIQFGHRKTKAEITSLKLRSKQRHDQIPARKMLLSTSPNQITGISRAVSIWLFSQVFTEYSWETSSIVYQFDFGCVFNKLSISSVFVLTLWVELITNSNFTPNEKFFTQNSKFPTKSKAKMIKFKEKFNQNKIN